MSHPTSSSNGAAGAGVLGDLEIPGIGEVTRTARPGGWFPKLVGYYLRRNIVKRAKKPITLAPGETPSDKALSTIRWACVKSAVSGAATGAISTGATIFTAETEGIGAIVAGPIAALTIGAEMMFRAMIHVDLSCDLASIFDVRFDTEDDADLWRLYALAFRTHHHEEGSDDPGKRLVAEVAHVEGESVGEQIGRKVLGESVMRNIIPFVGIVSSAVTNYTMTRRLGDTVRRYMRYQRALDAVSARASEVCGTHLDLLIEGIWFIFTADGRLTPEEAAFLAHMLRKLDPLQRRATIARFTEDEHDWSVRIKAEVPEAMRDVFMRTLEVAAAVDKEVGLPERKILRRAGRSLDRSFSQERIEKMIAELEETGVLSEDLAGRRSAVQA
jgi:hypothetical protein